jgi:hypothetical protein
MNVGDDTNIADMHGGALDAKLFAALVIRQRVLQAADGLEHGRKIERNLGVLGRQPRRGPVAQLIQSATKALWGALRTGDAQAQDPDGRQAK